MWERSPKATADRGQNWDIRLIRRFSGWLRHGDGIPPHGPRLLPRIVQSTWTSIVLMLAASATVSAAEVERGRRIYERCSSCHVGPHLKGIIGRKAASLSDYTYSKAMRAAGEAGTSRRSATSFTAPGLRAQEARCASGGYGAPKQTTYWLII